MRRAAQDLPVPRDHSHRPRYTDLPSHGPIDAHGSALAIRRNDPVKHPQNVPTVGRRDGRLALLLDGPSELLQFRDQHHRDVVTFDLRIDHSGLSEARVPMQPAVLRSTVLSRLKYVCSSGQVADNTKSSR